MPEEAEKPAKRFGFALVATPEGTRYQCPSGHLHEYATEAALCEFRADPVKS